ncbi:SCO family protein [Roseateles amylovorans]|uniref:SCO family protein n=1 Tax=Roseateles amylovorans TaxID=2978473 RepID=A0ABY6AWV0_9BURK|nr:SCO family protein [Roseateles amylovorans]UXH77669.1 SCO family protein [Roseateles amylovorans]
MISRRLICFTALTGAALLTGCDKLGFTSAPKASFQGVDLTGANYARGFNLPDQDGKIRTLEDFKGKVVVVFFGFTQCPDVCPTTLQELAEVKRALGADGDRLQAVFISVDPERDKPEMLKAYMANFDPGFVALRGSPEQVKDVAKEFKVYYAKVPGKTPDSYTMDHTAASFLFDPQGRVRVFSRYGAGTQALMSDIKTLLAGQ